MINSSHVNQKQPASVGQVLVSAAYAGEERFLSAQADHFAGANGKEHSQDWLCHWVRPIADGEVTSDVDC
jgi:hypothetical protein